MDPDLITLRQHELAILIREAPARVVVPVAFGPGWAALKWREAEWALPVLARLRGIAVERLAPPGAAE